MSVFEECFDYIILVTCNLIFYVFQKNNQRKAGEGQTDRVLANSRPVRSAATITQFTSKKRRLTIDNGQASS
jgi:hypothetical protein